MGLDMYAYTIDKAPKTPVDFKTKHPETLHYWRKHPNLHGWMEQLYRDKGGSADCFNCVPVLLTERDLNCLEADVRMGALPDTAGFFFGETDGSEVEDDLAFIAAARAAIAEGKTVYYDSWW